MSCVGEARQGCKYSDSTLSGKISDMSSCVLFWNKGIKVWKIFHTKTFILYGSCYFLLFARLKHVVECYKDRRFTGWIYSLLLNRWVEGFTVNNSLNIKLNILSKFNFKTITSKLLPIGFFFIYVYLFFFYFSKVSKQLEK